MLKANLTLTLAAAILLLIIAIPSQLWFNNPAFHHWLEQHIPSTIGGAFTLFSVLTVLMTIGLPRQIAAFIAGFIFNVYIGAILATIAATVACTLTVLFSAKFLQRFVTDHYEKQQQYIHQFLINHIFYKAMIIRILPIGSNFLTNIIAGVCQLPKAPYIAGSCLGFIPQMVIFSLLGAGIKLNSNIHIMISVALCILAIGIGVFIQQKNRLKKTLL